MGTGSVAQVVSGQSIHVAATVPVPFFRTGLPWPYLHVRAAAPFWENLPLTFPSRTLGTSRRRRPAPADRALSAVAAHDRIIEVVEKGDRAKRRASRYRYLAD